jgi:hypothetical protein
MDFVEYRAAEAATPRARGRGILRRTASAFAFMLDRTFALFLGVGVGAMICFAFLQHAAAPAPVAATPQPALAQKPVAAAPAQPRQAPVLTDAAVPYPPHLVSALAKGQPVTVGVFGDSFGDGLWAALYHRLPKSGGYKVLKFSEPATGFTHPRDLADDVSQRLADQPVDIAVINFGANDTQGLVKDGKGYALLSPGWRAVYGERVDRFVAMLRAKGAMVYWVGLPKMRSPEYDAHIAQMNAFYAERMAALGVPYLSTAELSVDETGQFNAYLVDGPRREQRLMRAGDGIHMSMAGYERLSGPLVGRIQAYVARASTAARLQQPADPSNAQTKKKDAGE